MATQPLSSSAQPEGHPQVWAQEVLIAMSEQSGLTQEDDAATWFVRTVYGPNTNKKTTPYVPRPVGRGTTVGKARGRAGIETDMLEETGWRDRNQTSTAASAAASASASRNDDVGRMVEIHLRVSPSACKEIWRTCRNGKMKLSGIGAKDGRVRRLVLVEIEGMSTLTGDGDVAPSTLTNAIRATMAGTSSSSNTRQPQRTSNTTKATSSTLEDDQHNEIDGKYPATRSKVSSGRDGRVGKRTSKAERLVLQLERTTMSEVLRRLGERVIDVKEAFDALSLGRQEIPTSSLTKLFWTCGIDDGAALVRDYERGCVAVYGDVDSGVTYDDALRLYDHHETSMLGSNSGNSSSSSTNGVRTASSKARKGLRTTGSSSLTSASGGMENTTTLNRTGGGQSTMGGMTQSMRSQEWNVSGSTNTTQGRTNSNDPHDATLRIAFDKYDVDKDGYISFVDLRSRFRDMGRTNVPDVEIRRWIADKDRRGKGNVNFDEFRKAYSHVIAASSSNGGGGARLGGTVPGSDVRQTMERTINNNPNNTSQYGNSRSDSREGRDRRDGERRRDGEGDENTMTASDVREYRDKILEGKRAKDELEKKEENEIKRLFNNNQELMVRARAAFDKYDRGRNGYITSEQLKYVFETLGYK